VASGLFGKVAVFGRREKKIGFVKPIFPSEVLIYGF
jgi:hypothetical protein